MQLHSYTILCCCRIHPPESDQLNGSNLDQSNRSGPDLKISLQSEAVSSRHLCYFLTLIPSRTVAGAAIWHPYKYRQRLTALPTRGLPISMSRDRPCEGLP
ncbi:hypothetical protein EVAR_41591_1 [Eumeta japonica]|uniref:Uncharacterized protein n=1 Tax=Eumeta variegata TaxID=151549 RepID=A0A4C1Y3H3_EUMVA|nr:hypothetical protein EVAR_41591_1 [Eumeta japonica]